MDGNISNTCTFGGCRREFATLHDLIVHIEAIHIDFSTDKLRRENIDEFTLIPMSCVLRYSTDEQIAEAKEDHLMHLAHCEEPRHVPQVQQAPPPPPTDYDVYDPAQNNDLSPSSSSSGNSNCNTAYWAGQEANAHLPRPKKATGKSHRQKQQHPSRLQEEVIKTYDPVSQKYACPVGGCKKSYKNQTGIKYHMINYHEIYSANAKAKREYICQVCDKSYKTPRGLQAHHATVHNLPSTTTTTDAITTSLPASHFVEHVEHYEEEARTPAESYRPSSTTTLTTSTPLGSKQCMKKVYTASPAACYHPNGYPPAGVYPSFEEMERHAPRARPYASEMLYEQYYSIAPSNSPAPSATISQSWSSASALMQQRHCSSYVGGSYALKMAMNDECALYAHPQPDYADRPFDGFANNNNLFGYHGVYNCQPPVGEYDNGHNAVKVEVEFIKPENA